MAFGEGFVGMDSPRGLALDGAMLFTGLPVASFQLTLPA
jgi:hypothetical protein